MTMKLDPVTEGIARAWSALTGEQVDYRPDGITPGRKRWMRTRYMAAYVPSVQASPQEWLKAAQRARLRLELDFCHDGHVHVKFNGREITEWNGDVLDALADAFDKYGVES